MKRLAGLLFLIPVFSFSQNRHEFWGKLNVTHQLTKKWSAGFDLHYRRQANYQSDDKNIFHYHLGSYGRLWVYYRLPKQWTLLLSPIGYFGNEDILNTNGELKQTNELRITPGIVKSFDIGSIKNKNRFLYDIRFAEFDKSSHFMQYRFRLQNSFVFLLPFLNKKSGLGYLLSNEILIKKNKHSIGFDQNRLYNALQWKFNHSDIDLGYQWILQKGTTVIFNRNQLFVMLNLSI